MKTKLAIFLFILIALTAACSQVTSGSGEIVSQEMDLTGFDQLDINQGFNVQVNQGDEFSVVVHIDDNIVEYLQVEQTGDTLKLGLEGNRINDASTLQAEITMPSLTGLEVSEGSVVTVSGTGDDITIDASGGSDADLASYSVVNANIVASGGSQVTINASGILNADASGSSHVYYLGSPTMGQIEVASFSGVDPK
jgi:Putative auto-transporter adhesin, head GIN domain